MKAQNITYDQLPLTLNAGDIARALGISRGGAYELLNSKGFPTLQIGKRKLVNKEKFFDWIDQSSGKAM